MPLGVLTNDLNAVISKKIRLFIRMVKKGDLYSSKYIYNTFLDKSLIETSKLYDIFTVSCLNKNLDLILWLMDEFPSLDSKIVYDSYLVMAFYEAILEKGSIETKNIFINPSNSMFRNINIYDIKKILSKICLYGDIKALKYIFSNADDRKYHDLLEKDYLFFIKMICDITQISYDNRVSDILDNKFNMIEYISQLVDNINILDDFIKYDLDKSIMIVNTKWLTRYNLDIQKHYTYDLLYNNCLNGNLHNAIQIHDIGSLDITRDNHSIFILLCRYLNQLDICNIYIPQFVNHIGKILEVLKWIESLKKDVYTVKLNIRLNKINYGYEFIDKELYISGRDNLFWEIDDPLVIDLYFYVSDIDNLEDCPICYDNRVSLITCCNHRFCKDCIDKLYKKNNNIHCPMCRKDNIEFKKIVLQP